MERLSQLGKFSPLNMKNCTKYISLTLAVALVVAVLIVIPVGAVDPSATLSLNYNTLSWSIYNIPSGDEVDTWQLDVKPLGSSAWITFRNGTGYQGSEAFTIPDEYYLNGNVFRFEFQLASDGSGFTSNFVTITDSNVHFTLSINDIGVVSWTPVNVPVTLHFRWLNNWVEDNEFLGLPSGTMVFDLYTTQYNTIQQGGYINTFNYQMSRTLEVYATCTIRGVTYTSNTVYRLGTDTIDPAPISGEVGITSPLVSDIQENIGLLYHGVQNSRIRVYFLTAILTLLPMVGIAFIIKRWS